MRAKGSEAIATFELTYPAAMVEKFFQAVAWRQPTRPAVPPTLATVFREGDFVALKKLGVPLERVLHAEQEYRFHAPLEADVKYKGETFLKSQLEKQGSSGTTRFYVLQTNLLNAGGKLQAECLTTIVVRDGSGRAG